jgi:hypothetical protein
VTAPLTRPRHTSVSVARPLFQVLLDDSQTCACHVRRDDGICNTRAMRVTADDYQQPEAVLL